MRAARADQMTRLSTLGRLRGMSSVRIEDHGPVRLLCMDHGKVQALDLELCQALTHAFHELELSPARAGVLTGTGNCFSAGVDLRRVLEGGAAYVERFLPALDKLFATVFAATKPLVAAINGHAIAGGCVLVCACETRVMGDECGRIGVPELQVGVAFPWLALEIVRAAVRPEVFGELVFGAAQLEAADARSKGLVQEVVARERVVPRALECATELARLAPTAYALAKQQERQRILQGWRGSGDHFAQVLELWKDPQTQQRIRDSMARTSGRRG